MGANGCHPRPLPEPPDGLKNRDPISREFFGFFLWLTHISPAPLKAVIARDAGLTLKVDVQEGADAAEDEEKAGPGSGTAAYTASKGGPAAAPDKDGITKRLGSVVAECTKLQSSPVARGPDGTSLHSQFELVKSPIAKQDWHGSLQVRPSERKAFGKTFVSRADVAPELRLHRGRDFHARVQ